MQKYLFLCFFTILLSPSLSAQDPDSLADLQFLTDTTATLLTAPPSAKKKKGFVRGIRNFFTANYPHPGKAALFTFLVPGTGQAYNKKFWKVPIVYTAVGSTIYLIGKNARNYKRFRTAYWQRQNGIEDEFLTLYPQADRLKTIRDGYRKNREQAYIGLVAALALSAADAFVDAHLMRFNVSDDLSMQVQPSFAPTQGNSLALGLGVNFRLR